MNMEKRKEKQSHFRSIEQILVSPSPPSLFLSLSLFDVLARSAREGLVECRAAPRFEMQR